MESVDIMVKDEYILDMIKKELIKTKSQEVLIMKGADKVKLEKSINFLKNFQINLARNYRRQTIWGHNPSTKAHEKKMEVSTNMINDLENYLHAVAI